jgi:thiol-disulfide isomerase/thioredoxin
MTKLLMFHGRECPHCRRMMPLVERLEVETAVRFDKHEVWHDEANQDLMRSYQDILKPHCGGQLRVPAFLNPGAKEAFCGEVEYEELRAWAERQA